jgi:DNA-binding transcriptional LysR family regulator
MGIELRLLRHARALAEHRNFGRAARTLRMTQPALSRSIAQLERQVGTRLFDRTASGVEPTEMGSLLLARAVELLARADDLGREMAALQGRGAGTLRVGAGTYPAGIQVANALAALLKAEPAVEVEVVVENVASLVPRLRRRELDVVVGDATAFEDDPEFHLTPLATRQGYFVCRAGHPLLQQSSPSLTDVVGYPLVSTARLTPRLLGPLMAASRRQEARPENRSVPAVTCESLAMMKTIVAGSDAIAILPLGAIAAEAASGVLGVVPLVEPWLHARFAVIRVARRTPPPASETFVRLLLETDAEFTRLTDEIETRVARRARRPDRTRTNAEA